MQDDTELVRLVLAGNQQAYARLVDKYKGKIFALLYRMTGQAQDAQDLAQEVFTKAYFQLEKFQPDGNFSAWLYRIAANHCLDELRRRKRTVKTTDEEVELIDTETPEEAFLQKETQQVILRQIRELDEEYRSVFILRYIDQLSYREISETMAIPLTTVQMRLHRARKKLREGLEKGGASYYEMSQI
ncbi:sigma-70 family RNA polymerase sigma factor [Brevibacillus ruminantium]|uniref:Sigma-70 family RNA polymerase sigma factor n=1 Tax=Brevibacillus ruminantium TaxID=2950604 RepID=A0ABY4WF67_9BACL|nr:sigma-70 family RNA polymerase sigma factor [Brevibacillus ruminantium]USG64778.1 sigma-70 family RNA polymerase sigma factor [Brevibacillus ruminantium]